MLETKNIDYIEEALTFLKSLLEKKILNLKTSRNRKASQIISNILNKGMIRNYQRQFIEYQNKKAKLEDTGIKEKSDEYIKTQVNFKHSRDILKNLTKEKMKIKEDINSYIDKISEHQTKLETLLD